MPKRKEGEVIDFLQTKLYDATIVGTVRNIGRETEESFFRRHREEVRDVLYKGGMNRLPQVKS